MKNHKVEDTFKSSYNTTMSTEMDSKSEAEKNMEQLNLKVIGQDGQAVQFKIKRTTPFRKVCAYY